MKNLYKLLFTAITLLTVATGCGGKSDGGEDLQGVANNCPASSLLSRDMYNSIYISKSGMISLSMNKCKSSGYVSCRPDQTFTMTIDAKDSVALDVNECQGLGTFECEYQSSGGGSYIIFCGSGPVGSINRFKPATAWDLN